MNKFFTSIFKEIIRQVFGARTRFVFTKRALLKCRAYGLSQEHIEDVFIHGVEVKPGMRVRKYTGYAHYSIGLIYSYDKEIDAYVIITCWKREYT